MNWLLKKRVFFAPLALGIVILLVWEFYGRTVNPVFLSYPTAIGKAFYEIGLASPELLRNFKRSMLELCCGFGLCLLVGIPLGLSMGRIKLLEQFLDPFINAIYVTPRVVFLPVIVLWFGLGLQAKLVLVFLLGVFPIIINSFAGARNVDPRMIETVRAFGASRSQVLFKVIVPSSVPFVLTGIRLGLGMAIIGVVLGEMFTSLSGLGGMLVTYANRFQMDRVFVVIVMLGCLGIGLTGLVKWLERRLAGWRQTDESESFGPGKLTETQEKKSGHA